jgi:hypothetical protein
VVASDNLCTGGNPERLNALPEAGLERLNSL